MSENAFTGALPRPAVMFDACVLPTAGLWQMAQPTALNSERPLAMEAALTATPFRTTPPVGGGARRRMKLATAQASSNTAAFDGWPGLEGSSGHPLPLRFRQLAGSPRPPVPP